EYKPIDASTTAQRVGARAARDNIRTRATADIVAAGPPGDGVSPGRACNGKPLGLTRERDSDPGPCRGRRDRLHALDRSVRQAQRVEVRRSRSQIDGVCASAEIARARANNERVELRAGERDRIVTTGAGEVPGRDIAERRR